MIEEYERATSQQTECGPDFENQAFQEAMQRSRWGEMQSAPEEVEQSFWEALIDGLLPADEIADFISAMKAGNPIEKQDAFADASFVIMSDLVAGEVIAKLFGVVAKRIPKDKLGEFMAKADDVRKILYEKVKKVLSRKSDDVPVTRQVNEDLPTSVETPATQTKPVDELTENMQREQQGLPPRYVEEDPVGLTPQRMEDELQKMRIRGYESGQMQKWTNIENLPEDIIVVHATVEGTFPGANAAVASNSWQPKFTQALALQGKNNKISFSLVQINNFTYDNFYSNSQIGLVGKSGKISRSSTEDLGSYVGSDGKVGTSQKTSKNPVDQVKETIDHAQKTPNQERDFNHLLVSKPRFSYAYYAIPDSNISLIRVNYIDFDTHIGDKLKKALIYKGRFYEPQIIEKTLKIKQKPGERPILFLKNEDGGNILSDKEVIYDASEYFYAYERIDKPTIGFFDPEGTEIKEVFVKVVTLGRDVTGEIKQ
ncbi:Uncharacterised protein [Candidatus Venteria ishoeyi]|uniref:Uncharacterized protein n=2 Tax=Candidatus Venteria ishoeyi TaxID=1899563 RepID=A0A1H6F8B4_9GAMM|nr:Uncharacterised protein [Candidatus Venteria ishoeyi]